jgi:RND family efflux transporter MFP subunit
MTHRSIPRVLAGVLAVAFVVLGCDDAQDASSPTIPRVKAYEIGETTRGQARTLSGELVAGTSSPLSFGVSGTVDQVLASRGDTVEEGQVLATLDAEPLRLALEQARAELAGSRAKLVETEQAYERAAKLLEQRGISQADYEVATSQVRSARASLRSVQSKVEQQERDLRRTELRAPFAGRIADRSVDAFQEVAASDEAFVLQGDGQLKVKLQVPDTLIRNAVSFKVVVA